MSSAASADQIRNWFRMIAKIPFLAVIVLALVMQATKEFYPFSHYPMYSDLTPSVEYYYLTTARGEPLPQVRYFGFSTSWTKKMLNSRLRKITGGRNIDRATLCGNQGSRAANASVSDGSLQGPPSGPARCEGPSAPQRLCRAQRRIGSSGDRPLLPSLRPMKPFIASLRRIREIVIPFAPMGNASHAAVLQLSLLRHTSASGHLCDHAIPQRPRGGDRFHVSGGARPLADPARPSRFPV